MTIQAQFASLLRTMRSLPESRAKSLAITKLEEAGFWTSAALQKVESPIDWVAERTTTTTPK